MMFPVTVWFRLNMKTQQYDFNHIENNHVKNNNPTDNFQRGWNRGTWTKQFGWLSSDIPPKLIKQ